MNSTICLTTTLIVIHVVVGGWRKSLVLSIQIREPQDVQGVYELFLEKLIELSAKFWFFFDQYLTYLIKYYFILSNTTILHKGASISSHASSHFFITVSIPYLLNPPWQRNLALLGTNVSIGIEPDHHMWTVVQILRELHKPLILARAVVCIVFVFVHLNNHDLAAYPRDDGLWRYLCVCTPNRCTPMCMWLIYV